MAVTAHSGGRPPSLGFDSFCALAADTLGLSIEDLGDRSRALSEFSLDELSWARLVLAIQDVNRYFAVPAQADVGALTLLDLYEYCLNMTAGHHEPEDGIAGARIS